MAQHSSDAFSMQEFLWNSRPLVIIAPAERADAYAEQVRRLEDAGEGLADRDMAVIHALGGTGTGTSAAGHIELFDTATPPTRRLSAAEVDALRERYGVEPRSFAVFLVGKDDGVKLQSDRPVPADDLFSLIDSMPMRKSEMRQSRRE